MKLTIFLLLSLVSSLTFANELTSQQIQSCQKLQEEAIEIQQALPIRAETTTFITSYRVDLKTNQCIISTVKSVDTVRIIALTRAAIKEAMKNNALTLSNKRVYELLNLEVYYQTYKELLKKRGQKIKEHLVLNNQDYFHIIMQEKVLFHDKNIKDLSYTIKLKNI